MNRTSESGRRQSASAAAATAAAYGAAGLSRPDRPGPPEAVGAAESWPGEACRCWASPGPPADRGPQPSHGPGVLDVRGVGGAEASSHSGCRSQSGL